MRLIHASQQTKAMFNLAREFNVATQRDVTVSLNRQQDVILGVSIVDADDQTVESITFAQGLEVRANSQANRVKYRYNQPILHMEDAVELTVSTNFVLSFSDDRSVTSDVVIFYRSGSVQLFKDFN